jgi:light-regulated signal transduction histidine kinase (bacteriophytochrome)
MEGNVKAEIHASHNQELPENAEKLAQINADLQQKMVEMTAKLNTANQEIQSIIYSVSHDLRAPLRAIDGYSRMLEQDYSNVLDEEGLRLLSIVRSSTKNMDEMMTDLLSLSRSGSSEMKMGLIDMNTLVQSVFSELAPIEIQEKISFTKSDLPDAYGDLSLIRQVWINLISNSIKFSMPKENPKIEISGSETKTQCTYIIRDNGVGFNPDFKNRLFGLFQHLHKAGDFEGTGVGLAIVKRIVQRHDGQVWGDGQPGVGAEFSFTLAKSNTA